MQTSNFVIPRVFIIYPSIMVGNRAEDPRDIPWWSLMAFAQQRPRILYASIFVWIAVTGGRFLAPLLQDAGLTDAQIGLCLALQTVVSSVTAGKGGAWADAREQQQPGRGRVQVLLGGVVLGCVAFVLEGFVHHIQQLSTNTVTSDNDIIVLVTVVWHVVLRCIYAASTSIVFPVLDGLTLDFLNNQLNHDSSEEGGDNEKKSENFGQERLWGAVSWAIANLIIGPSLDQWGFLILYAYGIVSTVLVAATIVIYTTSQQQQQQKEYTSVPRDVAPDTTMKENNSHDTVCCLIDNGSIDQKDPLPPHGLIRQKSHVLEKDSKLDTQQIKNDESGLAFRKLIQLVFATSIGAAFMLALFCLSIGAAVVESLIFLYFEVLGSTYTLCAVTVLLTVMFEIPIFHVAPKLLKTYGSTNMLLMACFCYMTRVLGYSIVPKGHPWWVLLFEPLHGVTYACASLSSVDFVAQFVPKGYEASGQGMLYSLRGFGSVVGLLFGGYFEDLIGPRIMYRVLATNVAIGFGFLLLASFKEPFPKPSADNCNSLQVDLDLGIEREDKQASVELVDTHKNRQMQDD